MRLFILTGVVLFTLTANAGIDDANSVEAISDSAKGIDEVVTKFIDKTQYPGLSIAAFNKNNMIFAKAYGVSNIKTMAPFTLKENLALGSNVKTLVAAAVLQLTENNKLNLSDKLSQHIPFKLKQANMITIEDLLCHVSDIPDVFGGEGYENYHWQKASSQKEFINKLNENNREISPRSEYRYNNTGYFLLGMVIEHLSHQPLGDYFRERFFTPIHVDNAYYLGDSFYNPKLAKMYQVGDRKMEDYQDPVDYRIVAGAGALGGDIESYGKLFSAILSGSVISDQSKTKMKTPCLLADGSFAENRKKQKTGLGIEISEINSQTVFSRGGAMNGHVSAIYHFENTGLTMAIVGNAFMRLAPVLDTVFEKELERQFN